MHRRPSNFSVDSERTGEVQALYNARNKVDQRGKKRNKWRNEMFSIGGGLARGQRHGRGSQKRENTRVLKCSIGSSVVSDSFFARITRSTSLVSFRKWSCSRRFCPHVSNGEFAVRAVLNVRERNFRSYDSEERQCIEISPWTR